METINNERIKTLAKAFENDCYTVSQTPYVCKKNPQRIGMVAVSPALIGGDPGKHKKAYYIEGTPLERGCLMGQMASQEIERMAYEFVDNFPKAYLKEMTQSSESVPIDILAAALRQYLWEEAPKVYDSPSTLNQEIKDEIQGMLEGGVWDHPLEDVFRRLQILNIMLDFLNAQIFALHPLFLERLEQIAARQLGQTIKIDPSVFKIPIACTAFAIFGKAAGGGYYFGRDFQWTNAGVFQDVVTSIIHNPVSDNSGQDWLPFVSIIAPGMAQSVSAMNRNGVAAEINMRPAKNCNPDKLGLNSGSLVHCAIAHSENIEAAAKYITTAVRGVPYIYAIADGAKDRACIVEAGAPGFDPLGDISPDLLNLLPQGPFSTDGYRVRWSDDAAEARKIDDYMREYNLAKYFGKLDPDNTPLGFININSDFGDESALTDNCPKQYYFAPPRWTGDPAYNENCTLLATNFYLDPVMRLYCMSQYLDQTLSAPEGLNDFQWRYDELNRQICDALGVDPKTFRRSKSKFVDYDAAKRLIDYLAPYPPEPGKPLVYKCFKYYNSNDEDWRTIEIGGCTSIFDLKNKTVETHSGYFGDEWMRITLGNYLTM